MKLKSLALHGGGAPTWRTFLRYGASMTSEPPEPVLTGRLTVDALEGHLARVEREDGSLQDWPLANLPKGVREGDMLRWHIEGRHLTFEIDHAGTRERRQATQAQLDALNGAAPAGELDL